MMSPGVEATQPIETMPRDHVVLGATYGSATFPVEGPGPSRLDSRAGNYRL